MRAAALSVRGLEIILKASKGRGRLIDGIGFELAAGEVLGLVGESGSGKSITAKALLGLLPAALFTVQAERLRLGETDLLPISEKGWRNLRGRRICMVFQDPLTSLDPVFTAGQQLSAILRSRRGLGRRDARRVAADLLGRMGFADTDQLLDRYPHQLSGGMRQRIMLAMAMACRPEVLIADEPSSALDVTTQAQVLTLLRDMSRELGTAVLLITHDLGVVAQYCDRALVIQAGKRVEEAPVRSLFEAPQQAYTRKLMADVPTLGARRQPKDRVNSGL